MRLREFFGWVLEGIYRARRRVSGPGRRAMFSFAGRSAVSQRRVGPALLRCALRCSCRAVACGDRGVSFDRGRRPLVRRRWRRGFRFPTARLGCLPGPATASLATTVPASIKDSFRPVVSRELSEGPARPPPCRVRMPHAARQKAAHPFRFAPAAFRPRGASVPNAGASPRRLRNALASRKRHLGVGSHKLWPPRQRRISACRLVSQSVGVPSDHVVIRRHQRWPGLYHWHQSGTSAACLAPGPFRVCRAQIGLP